MVLAAAALFILLTGGTSIALWRAYTEISPESDRAATARQWQLRTALVSEQLVEKTKGLEVTQQESIDQLQMVEDQLQTVKRELSAQQAEAKQLSEQVSGLTEAMDGLRQSFASVHAPPGPPPPSVRRNKSGQRHGSRTAQRRRAKSGG